MASVNLEIAAKGKLLYITTLANFLLGYTGLFLAARYVGVNELGTVAFALSFAGMFTFLSDFGLNRSHTKKVSEGANLTECLSTYLSLRLFLTVVYVLVLVSSLMIWIALDEYHFDNRTLIAILLIGTLYYVPYLLSSVYSNTFLALRDVRHAQFILVVSAFAKLSSIALVAAFDMNLLGLTLAFAATGPASLATALLLSRKYLPKHRLSSIYSSSAKEYVNFATPIALAVVAGITALYLDKVIIELSLTPDKTAIYFTSQSLLVPLSLIGTTVFTIVFPVMSQLSSAASGADRTEDVLRQNLRWVILLAFPVTAFLITFSKNILTKLMTQEFAEGYLAFSILSVSYSLAAITSLLRSHLLGRGDARIYGRFMLLYFVVIIVLDFLLIPSELLSIRFAGLGIEGAATALLSAEIVSLFLFFKAVKPDRIGALIGKAWRIVPCAVVSAFISYAIGATASIGSHGRIADLCILVGLAGVYLACLASMAIALGALSRQEAKAFCRVILGLR